MKTSDRGERPESSDETDVRSAIGLGLLLAAATERCYHERAVRGRCSYHSVSCAWIDLPMPVPGVPATCPPVVLRSV